MAIAAIQAGANVLVEKPLAGSVGEAETIELVSRETRKFVAVGFQHLYMPGTCALKDAIFNGKIGSLVRVNGLASSPRNLSYSWRNSWAGRLFLNGHPVYDSPLKNAFAEPQHKLSPKKIESPVFINLLGVPLREGAHFIFTD